MNTTSPEPNPALMLTVAPILPEAAVIGDACRGFPVYCPDPVVDAAAELAELHATRHADLTARCEEGHRLRLIRHIDALVAARVRPPRRGARAHIESVGVVIDQIAACCAVGFRASRARVGARDADDAQAAFHRLCGEYSDLIDEVAAGICRLPLHTTPNAQNSGLGVWAKRTPHP